MKLTTRARRGEVSVCECETIVHRR